MKKLLLLLLAYGMFTSAFAQTEPGEPCCSIVAKDVTRHPAAPFNFYLSFDTKQLTFLT